jgi:histone H3/H4
MDIESEFGLPLASITRIVKSRLPEGIQVGKEAKLAFSKASGIFVLYLVSCALDICKESKRSTISAADIFAALEEVEFDDYKEPLRDYLNKYREQQDAKKAEKEVQLANAVAALQQDNKDEDNINNNTSKTETTSMDTSE